MHRTAAPPVMIVMETREKQGMHETDIRPIMADEYLPDRCMRPQPLDPRTAKRQQGCTSLSRAGNLGTDLQTFFTGVLKAYEGCGFVAWDGPLVVGHITFFPTEVADRVRFWGWGHNDIPSRRALVINCITLCENHKYRKKGIGTKLAQVSVDWAHTHDWPRIEVHRVYTGEGTCSPAWGGLQKGCKPFWDSIGFEVFRTSTKHETLTACIEASREWHGQDLRSEEDAFQWDPKWESSWRFFSMVHEE